MLQPSFCSRSALVQLVIVILIPVWLLFLPLGTFWGWEEERRNDQQSRILTFQNSWPQCHQMPIAPLCSWWRKLTSPSVNLLVPYHGCLLAISPCPVVFPTYWSYWVSPKFSMVPGTWYVCVCVYIYIYIKYVEWIKLNMYCHPHFLDVTQRR